VKCPHCNESVELDDVSSDDAEVEAGEGTLCLTGTLAMPCSECGEALKTCDLDDEKDIKALFSPLPEGQDMEVEYEVEESQVAVETEGRGRKVVHVVKAIAKVHRTVTDADGEEIPALTEVRTVGMSVELKDSDFEKCE
jgi:hypothetical protein